VALGVSKSMMIHTWDILRPISMALKMDRFSIALPQKVGLPTSSIYIKPPDAGSCVIKKIIKRG